MEGILPPIHSEHNAHFSKIKDVQELLIKAGITKYREQEITFVLKSSYIAGDVNRAYESLVILQDSEEGIVRSYDPKIKLRGAVNHNGVSCYLDSILFSMFCGLDSFEAMLYNSFEDADRNDLATLLRVWVNTVRGGRLVEEDLMKCIQESLATCGWIDAAKTEQQDASEAFSFITDKLDLPMLTLKMDLFHVGKEDDKDDHKFIRERLLEVAVPDERPDGQAITLEDCLETYFNSRVEVKRYLERRGTTTQGASLHRLSMDKNKMDSLHVEAVEVSEFGVASPLEFSSASSPPTYSATRPGPSPYKPRAPSIIQETMIYEDEKAALKANFNRSESMSSNAISARHRTGTLRKEVMMPAWQFFSLIPWYTDIVPNNDAQIEAHLNTQRPVLGICLKRYSVTKSGEAIRRGTHIDIPIEIGLPHFIHDDTMDEDAAAFGNFKLSLQSVVCHRGRSVYEGHYISLVRGSWPDGEDKWILFDDLAGERIRPVDIAKALRDECPYLLFYQIQPIDRDKQNISREERPPSYVSDTEDSAIAGMSATPSIHENSIETTTRGLSTDRKSFEESENAGVRGRSGFTRDRSSSITLSQESMPDLTKQDTLNITPEASGRGSTRSKHDSHSRTNSTHGERKLSRPFQNLAGKFAILNTTLSKVDSVATSYVQPVESSPYAENFTKSSPTLLDSSSNQNAKQRRDPNKDIDKARGKATLGTRHRTRGKKSERPDRECLLM